MPNNRINSDGHACGLPAGYVQRGGHVAKKQLTGEKLKKRAIELNVSLSGLGFESGQPYDEYTLQQRVMVAEHSRRERNLWVIAVISAVASVFSAMAAWLAVSCK